MAPLTPRCSVIVMLWIAVLLTATILPLEAFTPSKNLSSSRRALREGTTRTVPSDASLFQRRSNDQTRNNSPACHPLCFSYGRGADIWPPSDDDPVPRIEDSFPGGIVPPDAQRMLQSTSKALLDDEDTSELIREPREWKRLIPRAIARILRRAASAEEKASFFRESGSADVEKALALVALLLLLKGYIYPIDFLVATFLSGYLYLLTMWARSTRADAMTPAMPALPPQGHVPILVSNPLGHSFTHSITYDRWLKAGVILGLLAPIAACLQYTLSQRAAAARACARPLFFLACQNMTEAWSRTRSAQCPLPIRILVPVAYNVVRLGCLWNWTLLSKDALGYAGRLLAILNMGYWSANLFGFLLPVAVPRYMRSHVLGVEVEEVTVRPGTMDL